MKPPDPVKLFVAVIYRDTSSAAAAKNRLIYELGPVDWESPAFPFDITDYYAPEMGQGLVRSIWSFERLAAPDELVGAKIVATRIEGELSAEGKRRVNLDPGYLDYYKVVLASAKFGGQKVYLGQGVYADLVLVYEKGAFRPPLWGFPDFKSGRYDEALLAIRGRYHSQRTGQKV